MKKQLYRIVTGILAVAWMCLIFSFSNQPATESSKVSGGLCHRLVERANDTLHLDMTEKQQLAMAEKIEYPVRKAAHMTEYAILGLLSFTFYRGILKKEKRQFLAALLTAAVYAATDEFHQYFIPHRVYGPACQRPSHRGCPDAGTGSQLVSAIPISGIPRV